MKMKKPNLQTVVLSILLMLNLVVALGQVGMQGLVIENQEKIASHIDTLNVYLGDIVGQLTREVGLNTKLNFEVHLVMKHYRDGKLIGYSHHAGVLTNGGKEWIEALLGNNGTDPSALWIAHSNSTSSPSAAWTSIPDECTTGNMSRIEGAYVSTGTGAWNVSYTFYPTETNSSRLIGLYYKSAGAFLVASDTQTVVNYESGDTVEEIWMISVT